MTSCSSCAAVKERHNYIEKFSHAIYMPLGNQTKSLVAYGHPVVPWGMMPIAVVHYLLIITPTRTCVYDDCTDVHMHILENMIFWICKGGKVARLQAQIWFDSTLILILNVFLSMVSYSVLQMYLATITDRWSDGSFD
ncbi:hypothetical protein GQX74_008029 [Glossina fuscipes]|nr:hypothetical protein GQX74_008029 [Glossina fuscipes]